MPNDLVALLVALLPGFALILFGMAAFWSQREKMTDWLPLWRGVGVVLLSAGVILEWNGLARQGIVSKFPGQRRIEEKSELKKVDDRVNWVTSLKRGLAEAKGKGKPLLIDFYADWCAACVEMEKTTFRDKQVIALSQKEIVMVKIDVDKNKNAEAILGKYQVKGLPTVIFLGPDGDEWKRMVGYVGAVEMLSAMKEVIESDEP